ncbi:hypothetical protein [Kribbella flavida]|uniref:hypothetical protein n=1 Tax=Kribbella flavida TaxID=182640 RepID=UPI0011D244B8|nr:hypothetical protein [Kribbella flavida]
MTDSAIRPQTYDLRSILQLSLPAHVTAWVDGGWRPAWLISRLHCGDGWIGLVQYTAVTGHEHTLRLPIDRLAPPN